MTCKDSYFTLPIAYLWAVLATRWWWGSEWRKGAWVLVFYIIHVVIYLKASIGMYHVCDFPYYSCLGTFWHCHPYFTHQFYANVFFYTCYHYFFLTILDTTLIHLYFTCDSTIPPELVWVTHNVRHYFVILHSVKVHHTHY